MNEADTIALAIGLLAGLCFATCVALSVSDWGNIEPQRIKWLAYHIARFTPGAKLR